VAGVGAIALLVFLAIFRTPVESVHRHESRSPEERRAGEARVAATPETVKKLKALGVAVTVETGAGEKACMGDAEYAAAGATIAPDAATALKDADIVLKVRAPEPAEIAATKAARC